MDTNINNYLGSNELPFTDINPMPEALRPVVVALQNHIEPLKATVEWGPLVPYNITGQMNLHPRAAMQFRASKEKDEYVKFYDQVASDI